MRRALDQPRGSLESAEEFGKGIYVQAVRRGLLQAWQMIVLGDKAASSP